MTPVTYDKSVRAPKRSAEHRKFVASLPCVVCGSSYRVEAAHAPGERGMGQKASDLLVVPLCWRCHRMQHAIGWSAFRVRFNLDLPSILHLLSARPYVSYLSGSTERAVQYLGDSWLTPFPLIDASGKWNLAPLKTTCRDILIEKLAALRNAK